MDGSKDDHSLQFVNLKTYTILRNTVGNQLEMITDENIYRYFGFYKILLFISKTLGIYCHSPNF